MMKPFSYGWRWVLPLLFICIAFPLHGRAQDHEPALLAVINQDLVELKDGDVIPITANTESEGFIGNPVLSPNGEAVAYARINQGVIDYIDEVGGIGGGALPTDIWLVNRADNNPLLLQGQSPTMSFPEGDDLGISRSDPVWSPDGGQLVWTEISYPDFVNSLVVYDIANGETLNIAQLNPNQPAVPTPLTALWSDAGILAVVPIVQEDGSYIDLHQLYSPSGVLLNEFTVGEPDRLIMERFWIEESGMIYLAVYFFEGDWWMVDPLTGDSRPLDGVPELYSPLAGDGSASVVLADSTDNVYTWVLYDPAGDIIGQFSFQNSLHPEFISISPDGQSVATTPFFPDRQTFPDTINTHGVNGNLSSVPVGEAGGFNVSRLLWGPMAWRVYKGQIPLTVQEPEPVVCGELTVRLVIGAQGRVLPGLPNNLRADPGQNSPRVGAIPGGERFTVLAGPECVENIAWWQVEFDGVTGWTAEGRDGDYWVAPVS